MHHKIGSFLLMTMVLWSLVLPENMEITESYVLAENTEVTTDEDRKYTSINLNLQNRVRYFDRLNNDYNWTNRLSGYDPDNVLTIAIAVSLRPGITWYPWAQAGAAVLIALEDFSEENNMLEKYHFDLINLNDGCRSHTALHSVLDLEDIGFDVVLGMRCSSSSEGVGNYLSYYDIPTISNGAHKPMFQDKVIYSSLIRISDSYKYIGDAFSDLFKKFRWSRAAFLVPSSYNRCEQGTQVVREAFIAHDIMVAEWVKVDEDHLSDDKLRTILKNMNERSRVMIICLDGPNTLRFMQTADELNMLTPDYVYFVLSERVDANIITPWGQRPEKLSDSQWERRRNMFQRLRFVTLPERNEADNKDFLHDIYRKSQLPPFNYNEEQLVHDEMGDKGRRELVSFYDGMYKFLLGVNQSLADGTNPRSGRNHLAKSVNVTFQGIAGEVMMDSNADKIPTYKMWQYYPGEDKFVIYAKIYLKWPPGQRIQNIDGLAPFWGTKDGQPPPDIPLCGFFDELCPASTTARNIALIAGFISLAVCSLVLYLATLYIRKRRYDDELNRMLWKINLKDIQFQIKENIGSLVGKSLRSIKSMTSAQSSKNSIAANIDQIFTRIALYKGAAVAVKVVKKPSTFQITKQNLIELKQVKDMSHENLNSFIGACMDLPEVYILSPYCAKGSLQDVLENEEIKLDKMFKTSFISDLIHGMKYIHESPIELHGHLTSSVCLIDSRWVLKVADCGINWLRYSAAPFEGTYKEYKEMLWVAPELLRINPDNNGGTKKGDVYSFSIILQEILFRALPYFMDEKSPKDIVDKVIDVKSEPYRPSWCTKPADMDDAMLQLMIDCWAETPADRPSFADIKKFLVKTNKGRQINILDSMVQKLERYANNLEDIVDKRTEELVQEKKKTDQLLYRMLPSVVADKLKRGESVEPELYGAASVYFSDIVGFTAMASISTPIQVVDLLNDLYTCFDDIIAAHDVYKVETIGDAYMCVSGIPKRNECRHAAEIANMALAIRDAVAAFKIGHLPERPLKVRIGIHTGPCAAGVVGLTMPRYCLFGDTVNMASRMESNSLPMKIHVSQPSKEALEELGGFVLSTRGEIEVKGKGMVKTFWLDSRKGTFTADLCI